MITSWCRTPVCKLNVSKQIQLPYPRQKNALNSLGIQSNSTVNILANFLRAFYQFQSTLRRYLSGNNWHFFSTYFKVWKKMKLIKFRTNANVCEIGMLKKERFDIALRLSLQMPTGVRPSRPPLSLLMKFVNNKEFNEVCSFHCLQRWANWQCKTIFTFFEYCTFVILSYSRVIVINMLSAAVVNR